ncbi:MAG: tRNA pseudouridine(55) synthase TruB [Deferribacteraceae bacterium]|jgi:tRNA pseudouridine55 synthase|nr:tRNA pseudouridine(55) synthase TruB [Deferribacteraceae bacterium]
MNGVINVCKEPGVTSFYVVAQIRKIFKVKKAGHTGTLDPMAEGVLPVCLGHATKFAEFLTAEDKQYIAQFRLGIACDTFDTTGAVLRKSDLHPDESSVRAVLESFIGEPELTVSAFSAKKIDGLRAYDLARKGKLQDAGTAPMKIFKIELLSYNYPVGIFVIDCGKGVYVRSVINCMGDKLGSFAAMSGLMRSRNGQFHIKNARKLADIKQIADSGRKSELVTPVQDVLNLPKAVIKDKIYNAVMHGISPKAADYQSLPDAYDSGMCLLLTREGKLVAFGDIQKESPVPVKLSRVFQ